MPDDVSCAASGCAATTVVACAYVDRRDRGCPTSWCSEHVEVAGDLPYCRRHAGVMRARLADHQDSILPDLESRAPGLIEWLARDLADGVEAALMATGAGDSIASESVHAVHQARARERTWERSWRLCKHTGFVHRVCLQVADSNDTEVVLIVDRLEVARLTPPWISARMSGEALSPEEDARRRLEFREELIEAVRRGLAAESSLRLR